MNKGKRKKRNAPLPTGIGEQRKIVTPVHVIRVIAIMQGYGCAGGSLATHGPALETVYAEGGRGA